MHLHLGNTARAFDLMRRISQCGKGVREGCSFLCEDVGLWAVMAVAAYRNDPEDPKISLSLDKIISSFEYCKKADAYDELLYGRVGYLYALQFIRSHLPPPILPGEISSLARDTVKLILQSGISTSSSSSTESHGDPPLLYKWHGKTYLGAAHGISGTLTILMREHRIFHHGDLLTEEKLSMIERTVDWLISKIDAEDNLPSSLESSGGKELVQFCHGNPGLILVLVEGCKLFGKRKNDWMEVAERAGEVVWVKGLLRKGVGLCHGISGNAFALVALYDLTGDIKWLHRTQAFANIALDIVRGKSDQHTHTPDHPYILYEGMAGLAWLIDDLVKDHIGGFPAFTDTEYT
ncbi:hypothetical protein V865_000791 [Kwoniella europaea PYCC6329]|uniref:Lanthionine synthetase C-like protein n=1 Tax=Kwoniella europaea PYCC6329 TaxID=1423913 RepID=A0AAX4K9Y0_9TREE